MTRNRPLMAAGLVTLMAVAAVALTACDPSQTGAAAVVGGVRISDAEVNQAATDAIAAVERVPAGQIGEIDRTKLLTQNTSRLINSQLIEIAAAQEGVTVTQSEVDKLLADSMSGTDQLHFEGSIAVQAGVPPEAIDSFARDYLLRQKLGQKLDPSGDSTAQLKATYDRLEQVARDVGVTVSPRYGAWHPVNHDVVGPVNDLSVTPSASPAGSESPSPSASGQ